MRKLSPGQGQVGGQRGFSNLLTCQINLSEIQLFAQNMMVKNIDQS